jgi:hypothetical protein
MVGMPGQINLCASLNRRISFVSSIGNMFLTCVFSLSREMCRRYSAFFSPALSPLAPPNCLICTCPTIWVAPLTCQAKEKKIMADLRKLVEPDEATTAAAPQ